jgi:hypothetical protein
VAERALLFSAPMTRTYVLPNVRSIVAAMAVMAGCADQPETGSIASPGMLNGMLNGLFRTEGLTAFLEAECPLLEQRLLEQGQLAEPFPEAFAAEIAKPVCQKFMFYTGQIMLPYGETLTLIAGEQPVASFTGVMGLEALVAEAYPQYAFTEHGFSPEFEIARVLVTQVYAALTNGITRTVSFKTSIPALDVHRASAEDTWTRELAQLVPATPAAIAAMLNEPGFVDRLPNFFKPCHPHLTNYDYLQPQPQPSCDVNAQGIVKCEAFFGPSGPTLPSEPPEGSCPVPVVVHGNDDFDEDVIPERSCRILRPGELLPPGAMLVGDVIVPEGGCPLIYYAGRIPGQVIYDDREQNPDGSPEGCDFTGPSEATNCYFHIKQDGMQIAPDRIATWIFNVQPLAAAP